MTGGSAEVRGGGMGLEAVSDPASEMRRRLHRGPEFLGLSTGRAGSRYLTGLLNRVGIPTLHEVHRSLEAWDGRAAIGEVSAWVVLEAATLWPEARVWHFTRHPQPFVSSLLKFGFWNMYVPTIHDHLRREGDQLADSYLYWVDWNRNILDISTARRMTFRIEDVSAEWIRYLAGTIGREADCSKIRPGWVEAQEFAAIPDAVSDEVHEVMEMLGYA